MIYLDSSVLIAFLYEAALRPERNAIVARLMELVRSGRIGAMITFDEHFRQVSNLILGYTPEEYLATIESD